MLSLAIFAFGWPAEFEGFAHFHNVVVTATSLTAVDRTFTTNDCTGSISKEFDADGTYTKCQNDPFASQFFVKYDCTLPGNQVRVSLWSSSDCNGSPLVDKTYGIGECLLFLTRLGMINRKWSHALEGNRWRRIHTHTWWWFTTFLVRCSVSVQ